MAQTGYTPILIYSSSTVSQAPSAGNLTNSTLGSELAINITDGKLFYKDNANAVQVIAWKTTPTTAGGTGLTSYTAGDLLYYASGTAFTKLAIGATGRWLGSSGTAPQWNAPAALTKTDDTNVTLTLGGSASTALLNAASITVGWTGTLAVSRGGTGTGTAFTAGSVVFAGASGVYSQNNSKFFWDNTNNRLGINTATPSYGLDLHNTGGSAAMARIFGNDQANVRLRIENSGGQAYELVGGNPGASNSGLAIYDATAAATRVYLSSTGDVTLNTGNLIQGTAAKGVNFTANTALAGMTSQLLNWYEEGTWTPAYSAASGAFTTLTYSAQTGTYVRIGKVVYIKGEIRTSNVVLGTAAGILRITGLPFTPSGSEAAIGVNLFIRFNLGTSIRITSATLDTVGIYFETSLSNDTGANQVAATEMTTGATASRNYVRFSGFYNV